MKVRISEIVVGERRREDMGDIKGLADSIKKYGLLHPIVVDDQSRLVAGGRRLEACKLLGWDEILVTFLGELSDKELREMELEENIQRKDLTELEKSKFRLEYAEHLKERLATESVSVEQKKPLDDGFGKITLPKPMVGRPQKSNSINKIASIMGITKQTLIDDKHYIEAVEKHPELAPLPKTHAIEIARQLKHLPESIRQEKIQQLQAIQEEGERRIAQIDREHKIQKTYRDAISRAANLVIDQDHLEIWAKDIQMDELYWQEKDIDRAIKNLTELKKHLQNQRGPKLVQGGGK